MSIYKRLAGHGLELPPCFAGGLYSLVRPFGNNLVYTSGGIPLIEGKYSIQGRVGLDVSLVEAQEASKVACLNILSYLHHGLGDLNRIKQIVKTLCFVASAPDFFDQALVMDPATQILVDIFGKEAGCAARSTLGTYVLPGNMPLEMEFLVELHN